LFSFLFFFFFLLAGQNERDCHHQPDGQGGDKNKQEALGTISKQIGPTRES
jgi:hypothetical protein